MSTDKNSETTWIYALKEKGSEEVRYVGASVDPVVRFRTHMGGSSSKAVVAWQKDAKARGAEIELVCIEQVAARNPGVGIRAPEVAEAEDRWIVTLLDEGHDLLNVRRPDTHNGSALRDRKLMEEAIERGRQMFGEAQ